MIRNRQIIPVLVAVLAAATAGHFWEIGRLRAQLAAAKAAATEAAGETKNAAPPTLAQVVDQRGQSRMDATREALAVAKSIKLGEVRGALETLNRRPGDFASNLLRKLLLARWATSDPQAALAWIRTRDPQHRGGDSLALFEAWGAQDPEAALANAKKLTEKWDRTDAMGWMLGDVAEQNPQEMLKLLQSVPENERASPELEYRIYIRWGAVSPGQAWSTTWTMTPGFAQTAAVEGTELYWSQMDPQGMLASVDKLPLENGGAQGIIYGVWSLAATNPTAAASYVENMTTGDTRNDMIAEVGENWAMTDPQAALAWVTKMATGQVYDKAAVGIVAQMGETDPAGAAAVIAQLPDATTRQGAAVTLAKTWAQSDVPGALNWAQGLPATYGDARTQALQSVMQSWVASEPADAAAYVSQNMANDPSFGAVAAGVVGQWAPADPQAALAWAETLPAGPAQASSVTAALTSLAKSDPSAATNAVYTVPNLTDQQQAALLSAVLSTIGTK